VAWICCRLCGCGWRGRQAGSPVTCFSRLRILLNIFKGNQGFLGIKRASSAAPAFPPHITFHRSWDLNLFSNRMRFWSIFVFLSRRTKGQPLKGRCGTKQNEAKRCKISTVARCRAKRDSTTCANVCEGGLFVGLLQNKTKTLQIALRMFRASVTNVVSVGWGSMGHACLTEALCMWRSTHHL
jgi:hypothetical protein